MAKVQKPETLRRLRGFLEVKGHGGMAMVAAEADLTRETIRRAKEGGSLLQDSWNKIAEALDVLAKKQAEWAATEVHESSNAYAQEHDLWDIVASDLETLAGKLRLRGRGFDHNWKAQRLGEFAGTLQAYIEAVTAEEENSD